MNKKGISLVALVITIIVLIILTAAVVITGINTPANAEKAVRDYNMTVVQDAVTLYVMNNMFKSIEAFVPTTTTDTLSVKDILTASEKAKGILGDELKAVYTTDWTADAQNLLDITLTDTELKALFDLDVESGKVTVAQ